MMKSMIQYVKTVITVYSSHAVRKWNDKDTTFSSCFTTRHKMKAKFLSNPMKFLRKNKDGE